MGDLRIASEIPPLYIFNPNPAPLLEAKINNQKKFKKGRRKIDESTRKNLRKYENMVNTEEDLKKIKSFYDLSLEMERQNSLKKLRDGIKKIKKIKNKKK